LADHTIERRNRQTVHFSAADKVTDVGAPAQSYVFYSRGDVTENTRRWAQRGKPVVAGSVSSVALR
jgi:hypothetical protein